MSRPQLQRGDAAVTCGRRLEKFSKDFVTAPTQGNGDVIIQRHYYAETTF